MNTGTAKQQQDMMDDIHKILIKTKGAQGKFKGIVNGCDGDVGIEKVVGILVDVGCGDSFNAIEFLEKYVVDKDNVSASTESADKVVKDSLKKLYKATDMLQFIYDENEASKITLKYEKKEVSNLRQEKVATEKMLKEANEVVKNQNKLIKELNKKITELGKLCDTNTVEMVKILEDSEEVEKDNEALKRTIKLFN